MVPVMIDKVGIRNSVFGTRRTITSRRAASGTRRRIGPTMNPMNRSMPVHITPHRTCTKLRNQRFPLRMANTITTSASAAYQR